MDIEHRIRNRIEAILTNDERNYAEIKRMATNDEPLEADSFAEERNLYRRIISSYRSAVSEVNKLLEENVNFLSGFYRIVESIKEKDDFQEICSQIIDCVLEDFGAEYCSLLFKEDDGSLCLEGINEDRKFLRIHSDASLLGSEEFERQLTCMAGESSECLSIEDVYKESRFNTLDFPGVVRSVLCLPITLRQITVGFLILSHSLPRYFHNNHIRILKILGNIIAHLRLLHLDQKSEFNNLPSLPPDQIVSEKQDVYSIILLGFETEDELGRRIPLNKQAVREIRNKLRGNLEGKETILFYDEKELLVLLPGVSSELLSTRVRCFKKAFQAWKAGQSKNVHLAYMNLGFSSFEGDEDLTRTLEVSSLAMHPEADKDLDLVTE